MTNAELQDIRDCLLINSPMAWREACRRLLVEVDRLRMLSPAERHRQFIERYASMSDELYEQEQK